jgi:hypothetical protein
MLHLDGCCRDGHRSVSGVQRKPDSQQGFLKLWRSARNKPVERYQLLADSWRSFPDWFKVELPATILQEVISTLTAAWDLHNRCDKKPTLPMYAIQMLLC